MSQGKARINVERKRVLHGRPQTRREFIARNAKIAFGSTIVTPSMFSQMLFGRPGASHFTSSKAKSDLIPFLTIDLAGGAALPSNFLVGGAGGSEDLLANYDALGWNPRSDGYVHDFGLPLAKPEVSRILAGLIASSSPEARANFKMASVCHVSRDDTSVNPYSLTCLVNRAGMRGTIIDRSVSTINADSGGNSATVKADVANRPVTIDSYESYAAVCAYGTLGLRDFHTETRKTLATRLEKLAQLQGAELGSSSEAENFRAISSRSYEQLRIISEYSTQNDPRQNPDLQRIFQISTASPSNSPDVLQAIIYSALMKQSGPGVWTIGGCDYHDNTQTTSDTKDTEIGRAIGRAIELAHTLKKPLFIHMFTDGGTSNVPGSRIWVSDFGDRCISVMGVYLPDQVPQIRDGRTQLGHYTTGQVADINTLIGGTPDRASYAVFANYLNVCGRIGEFNAHAGSIFTPVELDQLTAFESHTGV